MGGAAPQLRVEDYLRRIMFGLGLAKRDTQHHLVSTNLVWVVILVTPALSGCCWVLGFLKGIFQHMINIITKLKVRN